MRVGVLGPVEVEVNDQPVPISGQRQRALLAALALDHGKVVPVERLVDVLWDSHPPATARTKVRAHVSGIRQAIGCAAPGLGRVVQTQPPGYRLCRDETDLDLTRFDGLTAAARGAANTGDIRGAAELFGQALALWRGPALADVSSAVIRAATVPLEEKRLLAIEAKATADLALGRCDSVAAELREQLLAHPFRERLRYLTMLAFYRLGCRADALCLYRDGYRLMSTELGLEPGPQLRGLQQRILADDPSLYPGQGR
jgi:DNA-binding SARP family transcriptional activator